MIYTTKNEGRFVKIVDLNTGKVITCAVEADTNACTVSEFKQVKPGSFRRITRMCAFDVVDNRSGATVDKSRP